MSVEKAKKISYMANTALLVLVFGLWGFFALYKVDILIAFSIPTTLVYVTNYYHIHKGHLSSFVRMVYMWLPFYMGVTTVCLGYNYGFHLYSFSLIPIIIYTEYMSYKLDSTRHRAGIFCAYIIITYLVSASYVIVKGPLYVLNGLASNVFLFFNFCSVISFIIIYTSYTIKLIIKSEDKLSALAHSDKLTGLFNRHYMIDRLKGILDEGDRKYWIAMVDVDDFKSVNDTYGHNSGDYVLKEIAGIMGDICKDCTICRWGGEEFLIAGDGRKPAKAMMEEMRTALESRVMKTDGFTFKVTCTIGLAMLGDANSIDEWVKMADDRLYYGKKNGKNRVVDNL